MRRDPTAFAELCEVALPHLVSFLQASFPQCDPALCQMTATDLLLSYHGGPDQYDPRQLGLFAYLRMAARRDLLNALDKQRRRERRLVSLDDPAVEVGAGDRNSLLDAVVAYVWLQAYTDPPRDEIIKRLRGRLSAVEEQVLLLMLGGVRDAGHFAQILRIEHLDEEQQRREVKRVKDRLAKKVQRFGRQIGKS